MLWIEAVRIARILVYIKNTYYVPIGKLRYPQLRLANIGDLRG